MCLHERVLLWKVVCAAAVGLRPTLGLFENGYALNVELNMMEVQPEGMVTSQDMKLYIIS